MTRNDKLVLVVWRGRKDRFLCLSIIARGMYTWDVSEQMRLSPSTSIKRVHGGDVDWGGACSSGPSRCNDIYLPTHLQIDE